MKYSFKMSLISTFILLILVTQFFKSFNIFYVKKIDIKRINLVFVFFQRTNKKCKYYFLERHA